MQLKISITCYPLPRVSRLPFRVSAFTLMELMVSVGIMVIIILSIGVTFSGASKSVSVSNATMEMMSSIRATQSLIERDVTNIDRNGFIAIRCLVNNPNITPLANGKSLAEVSYRFDQISFITHGSFPNHTGANTASPFTDSSTTSAALAWWGQGVLESANPAGDLSILPTSVGQDKIPGNSWQQWARVPPTGVYDDLSGNRIIKETEFTLMRHLSLLFPGPILAGSTLNPAGNPVMAYPSPRLDDPNNYITGNEGKAAHITSSRYSAVAQTTAQVMQAISADYQSGTRYPEIDFYTYRFRALSSVYDTDVPNNPFVNGYFRTTPIVMQGVSSFKIEWTDGKIFPPLYPPTHPLAGQPDPRAGQLKWYGPTLPSSGNPIPDVFSPSRYGYDNINVNSSVEQIGFPLGSSIPSIGTNFHGTVNLPDQYIAVFSYYNKAQWPKALRFTMHVASDRLNGGRDFVQVVNLPQ